MTTTRGSYDSNFEKILAAQIRRKCGALKYHPVALPYILAHTYTPDFQLPNGVYIEAKGEFKQADRRKHIAIKKAYPDLDIRFVFMRSKNKLNKKAKSTYADWCRKHGFLFTDLKIPGEWYDEK